MALEFRHWHPSEDELILHFYGEGEPESERRIDDHLRGCVSCRATWSELSGTLQLVDAARLPEAPAGFENVMWARVEQALMRSPAPQRSGWSMKQLVPLGAIAALVVAAVALAVMSQRQPATGTGPAAATPVSATPQSTAAKPDRTRERVLLTALDGHFEQTELLLVELMNAPDVAGGDLDFERATADDLVASGRLYRLTAEQTGYLPRGADARGPGTGAGGRRQKSGEGGQEGIQSLARSDWRCRPAVQSPGRRQRHPRAQTGSERRDHE